jgi:hypothetical protein
MVRRSNTLFPSVSFIRRLHALAHREANARTARAGDLIELPERAETPG